MKDFGRKSFNLATANRQLKWVYTFFLVFVLIGLLTNVAYGLFRIGLGYSAVAGYYRGAEQGMQFGKEFGELLNTSHFHAYIQGVMFLILTHLYAGTQASDGVKAAVVTVAFVSSVGDIVTPWLVRYLSTAFAPLMPLWWTGLLLSYLAIILSSLSAMWWTAPGAAHGGPR